jgi:hypothetical protein
VLLPSAPASAKAESTTSSPFWAKAPTTSSHAAAIRNKTMCPYHFGVAGHANRKLEARGATPEHLRISPAASSTAPITISEEPRKPICVARSLRIKAPASVRPRPMTATCTLLGRIASRPATTAKAPMVAITLMASVPVSAAAARRISTPCWAVIVPSASSLATSTRCFMGQHRD